MRKLILFSMILLCACVKGPKGDVGEVGTPGDIGVPGLVGNAGPQGPSGADGTNGLSIVTTVVAATTAQCANGGQVILLAQDALNTGVYNISDPNQSSAVICNGTNGLTPFSVVSPIQACGAASSPWKEVLLCLSNGGVMGDFSDNASGLNTRLAFIPNGTYTDTDNSGCSFTSSMAPNGSTTISWNAGSNAYSTWAAGHSTCQAH